MEHTLNEGRLFLVVIDETPEMLAALHYAAQRAAATKGRVAILYAIEPHEIFPWRRVEQVIDAAQENAAREVLSQYERIVEELTGSKPIVYIRRGRRREVLLSLIEQEPKLSLLVLGAGSRKSGPGPLIDFLTSAKGIQRLKIPLIVVPETHQAGDGIL